MEADPGPEGYVKPHIYPGSRAVLDAQRVNAFSTLLLE